MKLRTLLLLPALAGVALASPPEEIRYEYNDADFQAFTPTTSPEFVNRTDRPHSTTVSENDTFYPGFNLIKVSGDAGPILEDNVEGVVSWVQNDPNADESVVGPLGQTLTVDIDLTTYIQSSDMVYMHFTFSGASGYRTMVVGYDGYNVDVWPPVPPSVAVGDSFTLRRAPSIGTVFYDLPNGTSTTYDPNTQPAIWVTKTDETHEVYYKDWEGVWRSTTNPAVGTGQESGAVWPGTAHYLYIPPGHAPIEMNIPPMYRDYGHAYMSTASPNTTNFISFAGIDGKFKDTNLSVVMTGGFVYNSTTCDSILLPLIEGGYKEFFLKTPENELRATDAQFSNAPFDYVTGTGSVIDDLKIPQGFLFKSVNTTTHYEIKMDPVLDTNN